MELTGRNFCIKIDQKKIGASKNKYFLIYECKNITKNKYLFKKVFQRGNLRVLQTTSLILQLSKTNLFPPLGNSLKQAFSVTLFYPFPIKLRIYTDQQITGYIVIHGMFALIVKSIVYNFCKYSSPKFQELAVYFPHSGE